MFEAIICECAACDTVVPAFDITLVPAVGTDVVLPLCSDCLAIEHAAELACPSSLLLSLSL